MNVAPVLTPVAAGGALSAGAYIAGMAQLAVVVACACLSAHMLLSRRSLIGIPRVVGFGLLSTGAVIAAELLPLLFGVLGRGSALIAAAVVLAISAAVSRRLPETPTPLPAPDRGRLGVLAVVGILVTGAFWLAAIEVFATQHVSSVDALSFHLPGVVGYLQSGSLWHLTQYIPGQAQDNYPQFGDLLLLSVVLPFHSLALVRYVDPVLLGVASLAAYEAASELGVRRHSAAILTLVLFSLRPALETALPEDLVDPAFLLGFCAGLMFLARQRRTGSRADLLLGGAGLALALGSKWYGLEDVPVLIVCWAVWARPGWRRFWLLVATVALLGGVWLVRNLVLTGDPIFDEPVRILGLTLFSAPYSWDLHHIGFSLAHYALHPTILRIYVWPVFRSQFGIAAAVLVIGAILARRPWFLSVAALFCLAAYVVTPYTALGFNGAPVGVADNTRYAVPVLVLCMPLCGLALRRLGPLAVVVELGLLILAILNLHNLLPEPALRLALSAVVLLVIWALRESRPAVGLALIAAVCVAFHYQRVLAQSPFEPDDPTIDYVLAHDRTDTRIAITGIWDTAGTIVPGPLFGPRLSNTVIDIGPWVDHRLGQYVTAASFDADLRREHPALLEVGTGDPPVTSPEQVRWAEAAGYRVVAQSVRLILLVASTGSGGGANPL